MLSKALNLARLWKWVRSNPCELVEREPENNDIGKYLTDEQEERLLAACRNRCNGQLEEIVIIALHTGMRESEILGLQWNKIDFKERSIEVIQKGNRKKVVPMNDTVYDLLTKKSRVRSMSGYVFTTTNDTPFIARNMYREFQKACKEAGLQGFRFHDLRHTCGTRLAQGGVMTYMLLLLCLDIPSFLPQKDMQNTTQMPCKR